MGMGTIARITSQPAQAVLSLRRYLPRRFDAVAGRRAWVVLGVLAAGVALAYWPTLVELARVWLADSAYSHGWLIVPLACWLGWRLVQERPPRYVPEPGLGALEAGAGALLHLAALVVGWPLLDYAALVLLLRGVTLAVQGRSAAALLTFPFAFLFFMFPLPGIVLAGTSLWLQDVVARISGLVLDHFWVCRQQGHALQVMGLEHPLIVGAECSGLRQLIALAALAVLLAHLGLKRWWSSLVLVAATVPVAVLANVARVVLMAAIARRFGMSWLDNSWLHSAPALFTFPLGIGLLLLFRWGLHQVESRASAAQGQSFRVLARGLGGEEPSRVPQPLRLAAQGVLGVGLVLAAALVLQGWLLGHLEAGAVRRGPVLPQPLDTLPQQLGDWQVSLSRDPDKLRDRLGFADDTILRSYQHGSGMVAQVYLVYSSVGKDREHHPEICMSEVAGVPEIAQARRVVSLEERRDKPVQRFVYRPASDRRLFVWYWHYTLEPPLRPGQTLLQALHQRLSRRPASLTVQVSAELPEESASMVERSLLVEIDRSVRQGFLPGDVRMGCDRIKVHWLGPD